MEIKVKNCNGCPFCVTDIDYECVGNDTLLSCNLASMIKPSETIIGSYSSSDLFNHDLCDYCESHSEEDDGFCTIRFDESKCKCKEIQDEVAKDGYDKINFNPDWCPLKELKTLNIIYDKSI
jgi:hypothetical protein